MVDPGRRPSRIFFAGDMDASSFQLAVFSLRPIQDSGSTYPGDRHAILILEAWGHIAHAPPAVFFVGDEIFDADHIFNEVRLLAVAVSKNHEYPVRKLIEDRQTAIFDALARDGPGPRRKGI